MVDFQLVMGGLRPFGTEKIVDLKSFLRHHWDEVKNRSGQDFQYDILDNTNFIYDTEPPSRAVVAMRTLNPAKDGGLMVHQAGHAYNPNFVWSIRKNTIWEGEAKPVRGGVVRILEPEEIRIVVKNGPIHLINQGRLGWPCQPYGQRHHCQTEKQLRFVRCAIHIILLCC